MSTHRYFIDHAGSKSVFAIPLDVAHEFADMAEISEAEYDRISAEYREKAMKHKMVIVMRHDLHMRMGKAVAQGAHAAMIFLVDRMTNNERLSEAEMDWLERSAMKKVCVRVESLDQLMEIQEKATMAGIRVHVITDAGFTEFTMPTITCLALGPDLCDKLDPITGHLKLL